MNLETTEFIVLEFIKFISVLFATYVAVYGLIYAFRRITGL